MTKITIFECVDEAGIAIGQYFETLAEAQAAATEMGLTVRRATIDQPEVYSTTPEPQDFCLSRILKPDSAS